MATPKNVDVSAYRAAVEAMCEALGISSNQVVRVVADLNEAEVHFIAGPPQAGRGVYRGAHLFETPWGREFEVHVVRLGLQEKDTN